MLNIITFLFKKRPSQISLFSKFSTKPKPYIHSPWDYRKDLHCLAIVVCMASLIFSGLILQKEYLSKVKTTPINIPLSNIQPVRATEKLEATLSQEKKVTPTPTPKPKPKPKVDTRVTRLSKYLKAKGSPLAPHAQLIVTTSDKYKIDWRVVVGIAEVESSLGLEGPFPAKCKNAWGYNRYKFCYKSWSASIPAFVNQANKGYPGMIPERMDNKYCTSCAKGEWAKKVRLVMARI